MFASRRSSAATCPWDGCGHSCLRELVWGYLLCLSRSPLVADGSGPRSNLGYPGSMGGLHETVVLPGFDPASLGWRQPDPFANFKLFACIGTELAFSFDQRERLLAAAIRLAQRGVLPPAAWARGLRPLAQPSKSRIHPLGTTNLSGEIKEDIND